MLVQKLEELMFKFCMLTVLLGFIKILFFYVWQKFLAVKKLGVKRNKKRIKSNSKFNKNHVVKSSSLSVKSNISEVIQTSELLDLKLQAKELFKTLLQNKKINRAEILDIKDYLLENVEDPTLSNKKYKNDAHCIYSLFKSKYIDEDILKEVINFMLVSSNRKIS